MPEHIERQFMNAEYVSAGKENRFEIEEQAKLDPGQDLLIQQQLLRLGGTHTADTYIEDVFFCPKEITSFSELTDMSLHHAVIRIRKSVRQNTDGYTETRTIFTTKQKRPDTLGAWDEHEYARSGDMVDQATRMLTENGLKPYYSISKTRSDWNLNGITLSFDHIPEYGTVLEAEKQTARDSAGSARKDIRSLLRVLGVRPDQKPDKSIMEELPRSRITL